MNLSGTKVSAEFLFTLLFLSKLCVKENLFYFKYEKVS